VADWTRRPTWQRLIAIAVAIAIAIAVGEFGLAGAG
jgi:hypothetical protein